MSDTLPAGKIVLKIGEEEEEEEEAESRDK